MSIRPPRGASVTIAYCDGHRCRALRHRSLPRTSDDEPEDLADVLRQAVRDSHGGVLIPGRTLVPATA
jgi:hypothetical protein